MTRSGYTPKFEYPDTDWEEYIALIERKRHDAIPDDADTERMFHVIDGEWFSQGGMK